MEIDDLTRYGVLAEELHFRRAAARLGISQPGLTRRIRRLEREFGVYLVERHANRLRLTAAGEILAERATRFTRDFARLKADIADAGQGIIGQLAVGFFTSLSSAIFLQVLRSFCGTESGRSAYDTRPASARSGFSAPFHPLSLQVGRHCSRRSKISKFGRLV
jgi:DNA-binding transcriptional LysR family regulator